MKKSNLVEMLSVLFFTLPVVTSSLNAATVGPLDLSSFTVNQYDTNIQPSNAVWTLGAGNTSVTQKTNNEPSFFLGGFESVNTIIDVDFRVDSTDDDLIGFVWGYQDFGDFYNLEWRRDSNPNSTDKLRFNISSTGSDDPFATWPITTFSTQVLSETGWDNRVDYHLHLIFTPGSMAFDITQGVTLIHSASINDTTYTSGKFGFYTQSQDGVTFSNLMITAVPIPPAIWLFGSGLIGLIGLAGRKKASLYER